MSVAMSESLEVNVSVSEVEITNESIDRVICVERDSSVIKEEEVKEEVMVDIINLTLQKMFENFLQKNAEELKKVNVKLSPEIQKYFILFCQENPGFFTDIETSLKAIIVDNTINSKDIPELLNLMSKIYILIKDKKLRSNSLEGVDPYDIIETLMKIAVMLWVEKENKDYSVESVNLLVEQVMSIVRIAIKLMKLPIMEAVPKKGCFGCFGK